MKIDEKEAQVLLRAFTKDGVIEDKGSCNDVCTSTAYKFNKPYHFDHHHDFSFLLLFCMTSSTCCITLHYSRRKPEEKDFPWMMFLCMNLLDPYSYIIFIFSLCLRKVEQMLIFFYILHYLNQPMMMVVLEVHTHIQQNDATMYSHN